MATEDRDAEPRWASQGLEIQEDMRFQRRNWAAERVAWALISLVIAAALLGLFSRGPLSAAEASDPDGALRVTYERFLRHHAASTIEVELSPLATEGERVELRLSGPMLRAFQIETMRPEPVESRLADGGWVLAFPVLDRGRPSLVRLEIRPDALATQRGEISVEGRPPARLSAFVYP